MRLLLAHGTPNRHSPIPRLAAEQIDVGPDQLDRDLPGRVFSRRAPVGSYDLAALVQRLPEEQRPDAIAVAIDGAATSWPVNLVACNVTRLLLLGDSLAKPHGLARVLAYARSEKFDRIVLTGSDADAALFQSATDVPLRWFPGLLSPVRDSVAALVRQERRDSFIACAPAHLRRFTNLNLALGALNRAGIAYGAWGADHAERMEYLGHAEFALVPSEHGEWSNEFFEALAAGALVLTNPNASAVRLWPEGTPFVVCAPPAEFAERVTCFRSHPAEAAAIRRAAAAWWDANLSESRRREAMEALVFGGGAAHPQDALGGLGAIGTTRSTSDDPPRAGIVARKPVIAASEERIAKACDLLESGLHDEAMALARPELNQPLNFADALVICADVALESARWPAWNEFRAVLHKLDPHDPRLRHLETRATLKRGLHPRRMLAAAWRACDNGDFASALKTAERLLAAAPRNSAAMLLRAVALQLAGRLDEAGAARLEYLRHSPNSAEAWRDHGLLLSQLGRADEARDALRRAHDLDPRDADIAAAHAITCTATKIGFSRPPERDLLITMPETSRRHGTGVLLQRFFPDSSAFVTLRSFTNYGGIEEFGSANLLLSAPHLNDAELATRLKRTLEPWRIRRILCVPFSPADFKHARLAREFTGAPLCTYVMDDQNLVPCNVPDALAHCLFEASDLRLTISPEMQAGYAARYPFHFDLMPPIVVDGSARRENRWSASIRPANHAALVGNVWSEGQLKQVARFIAAAGLRIDWFGREPLPNLAKAGLHGQGFLPEGELADRLTQYPFVLVPSGALDGTEDNEWLTRLSLPSRMVFLLQTQTPMLVLGSAETAAGSFVERLGVGRVLGYNARDARKAVREFTQPAVRNKFLESARAHAGAFLMPDAGEWIWRSLAAGRAQPAPFDGIYRSETEAASADTLALAG